MDDLKYSPQRVKVDATNTTKAPNNPYVDRLLFPHAAHVLVVKIADRMNKVLAKRLWVRDVPTAKL